MSKTRDKANTPQTNFSSTGIDDNATSTAVTIDSSGQVGIGTSSPSAELHISKSADAGNAEFLIENSFTTAGSTDETVRIQGRFGGYDASYIVTGKELDFTTSGNRSSFMSFWTRGAGTLAEAMRIDSSGKVGIGDSSPESTLTIVESANNTNGTIKLTNSTVDGYATTRYVNDAQAMWVGVDGSVGDALCIGAGSPPNNHRLVVQPSGNVLIGTTSTNSNEKVRIKNGNDTRAIAFQSDSSAEAGYIYINSGGTSVSYSTSSDYRLKENVVDLTSATDRLKQLQPKRFNFIADADTTVDGFLAHEVSSIVPEAINGEKDELDADGNPVYQGIDQSKLVPLLTASLQEAIAKIEELETRLEALEKL